MATRPAAPTPKPAIRSFLTPDRVVLGLILVAALILQGGAIAKPFFADDYLFLDQVRHRSLFQVLAAPDPIGNFFRPFGRQFYFWFLSRLTGQSVVAFHAVNLGLFLGILVLLFSIARRLGGLRVAAVATAIVALSYTADVPVRWCSGSQDLIAVAGVLLAMWLLARGHRLSAAVALFLALLSKETIVLTPLLAIPVARQPGEPWRASARRAWPLFAGAAAWAVLYVAMSHRHRGSIEGAHDPLLVLAALLHLLQTTVGAEWRKGDPTHLFHLDVRFLIPMVVALIVALLAVAWSAPPARPPARPERGRRAKERAAPAAGAPAPSSRHALMTGVAWALAGALPVAAVASIWSAYFYLFAICGVALALGSLASRLPGIVAMGLVALLAWGSETGRELDEFYTGPGAWSVESHVNRFYLDRAMDRIQLYLSELRERYPKLAPRTTILWSGVPSFLGWQVADGPLVRWAYADSSLRSYFLSSGFTLERAQRGPVYFLQIGGDSLHDLSRSPHYYKEMAEAMVLAEKFDAALAALSLDLKRDPSDKISMYWLGIVKQAMGDTVGVAQLYAASEVMPRPGPAPQVALGRARLAARDTAAARDLALRAVEGYGYDPQAHSLLADIMMSGVAQNATGVMEALAHRALAPNDPLAWRRWAYIQTISRRFLEGYTSIKHYFAIGGAAAAGDSAAVRWRRELERMQPGGQYIQEGLRVGRTGR